MDTHPSLLPHQNTSHEFVVAQSNQEQQEPQQLLLAIPSHALSEANQINAALPQLNQLEPQLHYHPSAALCPLAMADQCPPQLSEAEQVLLGEDHISLDANNSNIFFATNFETNETYLYEYLQQPNSNNSQSLPIYYNLIDCFVDEARGEIKAEQVIASPEEYKFFEIPSSSSTITSPLLSYSHYYHTSTTSSSESPPTTILLQSDSANPAASSSASSTRSSSFFYNSSPSETSSSPSESPHDDNGLRDLSKTHGKKYCLFGMTYEEVNERKRQQNKNAARRYRERKQKEFEKNRTEIYRLQNRNMELRDMEKFLAEQIDFYKKIMISKVNS